MATKEILVLSDPDIEPDEKLIHSKIGEKIKFWHAIMTFISDNYSDMEGGWRYYNDGKQWLFKMVQKKKTIFWGAILKDAFRITFYLGGKAEPVIVASDLSEKSKQQYLTGQRFGKIRAITTLVNDATDVSEVEKLIAIKVKLK